MDCWNCVYWEYIKYTIDSVLAYGRCRNKLSENYLLITDEVDNGCDKGSDTLNKEDKEDATNE